MTGWQAFFGFLSGRPDLEVAMNNNGWLTLEEAMEIWNQICGPLLGRVRVATQKRRQAFRKRQEEIEEYRTREGFELICNLVISSPFLRGEKNNEDHIGWKAHFDFILQATSAARLVEGFYHRDVKPKKTHRYPVYSLFDSKEEVYNNGQQRVTSRDHRALQEIFSQIGRDIPRPVSSGGVGPC
jgi:hypothetical protein